MNIDKSITIIKEYIEEKLGGNVTVTKSPDTGIVIFAWAKNEKTIHQEIFRRAYSYEELELITDLSVIGHNFVEAYTHPEKPVIEEPKKKPSRKKTVEVPPVEEAVDLEVKETIEPTEPPTEEPKAEENG